MDKKYIKNIISDIAEKRVKENIAQAMLSWRM